MIIGHALILMGEPKGSSLEKVKVKFALQDWELIWSQAQESENLECDFTTPPSCVPFDEIQVLLRKMRQMR